MAEQGYSGGLWPRQRLVAVKAPVFSMAKLVGVDTYLGPEMKSTGEVMGIDFSYEPALEKALIAAGMALKPEGALLLSIADQDKLAALPLIRQLHERGYKFYATEGTAVLMQAIGLPVQMVPKKLDEGSPNVIDVIRSRRVIGVINTVTGDRGPMKDGFAIRRAAAENGVPCFTSLDTAAVAVRVAVQGGNGYSVAPMSEYVRGRTPAEEDRNEAGPGDRSCLWRADAGYLRAHASSAMAGGTRSPASSCTSAAASSMTRCCGGRLAYIEWGVRTSPLAPPRRGEGNVKLR